MNIFKIVITSKAQSDLAECISFVLNVSKDAAHELSNEFFSSIKSLQTFPERNSVFEMPKAFPFEIRRLVVRKRYVILYSINGGEVVVYRILDSRRKFNYIID